MTVHKGGDEIPTTGMFAVLCPCMSCHFMLNVYVCVRLSGETPGTQEYYNGLTRLSRQYPAAGGGVIVARPGVGTWRPDASGP